MNDNEITAIVGWPTEPEMAKFRKVAAAAEAAERERWKTARLLRHDYQGLCPDEQNGWDSRDMDCPACRVMAEFGD